MTGEVKEGEKWYKEPVGYLEIPLFVKPAGVIAMGCCEEQPDYPWMENLTLWVASLQEGEKATVVLYDEKGENRTQIKVIMKSGSPEWEADRQINIQIRLLEKKEK